MKTKLNRTAALTFACLLPMLPLLLQGCVTGANVSKLAEQLKNDPAQVDVTITTPWGTAMFHRQFPTGWVQQPKP